MKYTRKTRIKALIAAGLLAFNVSGCKKEIRGYSHDMQEEVMSEEQETNHENIDNIENLVENAELAKFKKELAASFDNFTLTLDETTNEFVSSIIVDGTNVSIELIDGSKVSGTLYDLEISDLTLENLYLYDSKYAEDFYNVETKYHDYEEKGYDFIYEALYDDYQSHQKLELEIENCSVANEYKKGKIQDIEYSIIDLEEIDYTACKKLWLYNSYLEEEVFSTMTNLETLVLVDPNIASLEEETIAIQSNSLKNLIIDEAFKEYSDKFDFTGCPNLEILSIVGETQETDLEGLKGLTHLKQLAFGLPKYSCVDRLIDKDFQERLDLVSLSLSPDDKGLCYGPNCIISDISAINGTNLEVLNISFLKYVSSEMLLETVKSLPNLKQIVGFEVNNAGMCSDELLAYCEEQGIKHPFTERSLAVKHKLEEIVSNVLTDDMNEEEKVKALSEYIVSHMEYDYELTNDTRQSPEKIIRRWGECLYYSVIEGKGVCEGYTTYAQNLFREAGITAFRADGIGHTWNLVQIDDEYYFIDLTNIDTLMEEQISTSFDDYDLESYYLVPIKDPEDFPYLCTDMLPIEVEEEYDKARKNTKKNEEIIKEKKDNRAEKLGNYMIQVNKQNIDPKEYAKFCGMIGIWCALGLAKKITNKENNVKKEETKKDREGVIKIGSLSELCQRLKREQKINQLRSKRQIAEQERALNNQAKDLERQASMHVKGAHTR